ncbi:glycerophosphodiester phosphodiesterase family protein [Roseiconus lacunae]|uniref:glycerophosphodiester phosphodiesterase family protein n=1 Tax=Roseiconus lacunae TaxID=2605694 RepID=UPI001E298A7D|nr:glycerophosphodiester phosphodiesterase family protein [Roseiconus lacunae]MCD0458015.1 glycerophosphoryl diester phosphodiesterase membrane domain-containing protein [Roseiconus lacunae]
MAKEFGSWREAVEDTWKMIAASKQSLVATDVTYKLLAYILITPLFVLLFRLLLRLSGNEVLSDLDIAHFLLGPFGWFCGIAIAAVWLAILAFEQASLMWILVQRQRGERAHMLDALRFAAEQAPGVLRVTVRLVTRLALVFAPFLVVAALTYRWLLTDFDINFYLTARPSEFWTAVAVGGALSVLLVSILLRLLSGWFLALPLVLFEQTPPQNALVESQRLVDGHRKHIVISIVILVGMVLIANSIATFTIGLLGRLLIPSSVGSLAFLAARVGSMLLASFLVGLIVQLLAVIGVTGTMLQSYLALSEKASDAIDHSSSPDMLRRSFLRHVTSRRLLTAGSVVAVLTTVSGYVLITAVRMADDVEIMAHRGASILAPENTMAAYRRAIDDGADWIEIDVQETADGRVVVVHDKDLMKLAGNPIKIWESSFDQLSSIDIGSHLDAKFSAERVATLTDVLRLCKDQIGVNIELKYYGHDQHLEERVVSIVEAEGMDDQVIVMSLKPQGVAKTKALRPDWKYGLLLSVYVGNLNKIDTDFLAVNAEFASRAFVKRAHRAGKEVYVWTVDDPAKMSMLMNRNIDGILTNRPDIARDVIRQRAELSSSERLLAEISVWLGL